MFNIWLLLAGDFIDNIHQKWFRDYKKLERNHGYIQWFVPNLLSANGVLILGRNNLIFYFIFSCYCILKLVS